MLAPDALLTSVLRRPFTPLKETTVPLTTLQAYPRPSLPWSSWQVALVNVWLGVGTPRSEHLAHAGGCSLSLIATTAEGFSNAVPPTGSSAVSLAYSSQRPEKTGVQRPDGGRVKGERSDKAKESVAAICRLVNLEEADRDHGTPRIGELGSM